MNLLNIFILLTSLVIYCPYGFCERVLVLTPTGTKSHKIFFMAITEALAKRGHQVTVVSSYEPTKKIENVREIVIRNYSVDQYLYNVFKGKMNIYMNAFFISTKSCLSGLRQKHIQDLKKEKFDVIIFSVHFDRCYLSFAHHFKVPFIYVSPQGLLGHYHRIMGNIDIPSISGNLAHEPSVPRTFAKRLRTTVFNFIYYILNDYFLEREMYSECLKTGLCPSDMPPFSEIHKNMSLAFVNSIRAADFPPRPSMPNIIYLGGIFIKPPKKLPKELDDWIEGSGDEGFILFSLGSALNTSFVLEEHRKILINVFGSLKQRVLWKWNEESMPDLPKNVKLQKWLPQSDILGHPKIKLFITHGGLLSTQESYYRGVPVIGMPIFFDQFANMENVEMEGCGKVMNWNKMDETVFRNLILDILSDKKITEAAKIRSAIMQDRLVPPDEEAVYWVEYVIRHKGAPHLMSPLRIMKWYEVYNMDVWAFVIVVIIGVEYGSWIAIKFIFRKCFGQRKSKKSKTKKE